MKKWALVQAVVAALCTAGLAPRASEAPVETAFDTSVRPFLADHCYDCHDTRHHKGGLNLERFESAGDVVSDPDTWDKVLQKLRTGEMPPEDEIRPTPEDLVKVTAWISHEVQAADDAAPPEPGRVVVRRLNKAEYNNTVRDLIGLDLRPADDFPQDDTGYGFDTIGAVLSLPPVLMEKYLAAAERLSRRAVFGPDPMKPMLEKLTPQSRHIVGSPVVEATYDETGLSLPNAFHVEHAIPVEADYRIHAVAGGTRPAGSEPIELTLWIDGAPVATETLDPEQAASFSDEQQDFLGKGVDFEVHLTAGTHWIAVAIPHLFEGLPPSYHGPNPSTRPEPPPPVFKAWPDESPEHAEKRRKEFEEEHKEKPPANNVRAAYIELGGPYRQVTGAAPASREKIFVCGHAPGHHLPTCGRRIVSHLLARAFRRPVTAAEVSRYLQLVTAARARGESFETGIQTALEAVLVSPDFLFRLERDQAGADGPWLISDTELATRLSYFLWSSMPDAELRRLAATRQLRQPGVLDAQVRRMLADPKAHALVQQFGGQWLETRALESARPDADRFPDFDDYLRLSMRRETELFFDSVIREDRSILDFLTARYTYVNERLARHYGIPGIVGPEFRRVELADGSPRRGVWTQASVLTVASYATRTSPVLRGKWILENLLDAPPPAPPANVPRLDESKVGTTASLREQMEVHRADPTCASCHRRMDPIGFGLENFDAIGAWRTEDGKFPIDATGQLPDGRTFDGPTELAGILGNEHEAFARALTAKLLTYALGRGLDTPDHRTVRMIARRLAADDYRFSSLILEIVKSVPFQMREGVPAS